MDDVVKKFFSQVLPATLHTPPSECRNSHIQKNCEKVHMFLKKSAEKDIKLKSQSSAGKVSTSSVEIIDDADHDLQDPLAYTYYDKLWASSKNNHVQLSSQWQCIMEKVNKEDQDSDFSLFKLSSPHVNGMFYMCKRLNTNFVVKFRAVELFNRFLQKFATKHEEFMFNCDQSEMEEFKARLESQMFLRMCTCILISSKLHADTQVFALNTTEIAKFLATEGFVFSRQNIARSEMRVLETLDYRCLWVTPLELVEQLLCILELPLPVFKKAHYYCILLLEYCYMDLDSIRDNFLIQIKKSELPTVSRGKITVPLKCAGIVSAALFIVAAETKTELHKVVAKRADLNEEDVNVLAVLLLDSLNMS